MKTKDTIKHKNGQKAIIIDIFPHIGIIPVDDCMMYRVLFVGKRKFKYIPEKNILKYWKKI